MTDIGILHKNLLIEAPLAEARGASILLLSSYLLCHELGHSMPTPKLVIPNTVLSVWLNLQKIELKREQKMLSHSKRLARSCLLD